MTTPWDVKPPGVDVALNDLSVMIGMPTHRDIPPQTVASLVATVRRCHKLDIPLEIGMTICGSVVTGRDDVLDTFLKSECNRLFWIDSDQTWTPEQFIRLLAISKMTPIVGATYPAKLDPPTFYVRFDPAAGLEPDALGLIEVHGMGLGFTVLQRLAASKPRVIDEVNGREMASVFRWGVLDGKRQGEDMGFFADLRELGYKVYLDSLTNIGHIGVKEYRGSVRDAKPV
jgi:hypothetical protein